ncbi:D-alanine--D-alanine ligase family protein [[Clostridium] colinum]|uniref:D-alanine--D-alanine ligase family protein n=1 Tax=[Clostridium] colinum TaxID=36835 RepID=UPI00202503A3|nr:D-alanine--D-alanine ligase [[Clostridium] colinum]
MKTNLMILKGGTSLEREISLKSFENVMQNIDKKKYNILDIDVKDIDILIENIKNFKPHIVLNLIHGGMGEDGTIQSLLSLLNIKYVGSKALSSGICMDKNISKTILKANNIPVIDYVYIKKDENPYLYKVDIDELMYPVIVKPNKGGSSIGIKIAKNIEQVFEAIESIKKLDDDILIEKFISGKEVTCSIVQNKEGLYVLSILDINTNSDIFDYSAKYDKETNIDFSNLPNFLQTMIKEVAKKVFNVLKCEGYVNIDFIIKEDDIYVLEINTIPGFTNKSLLPKALMLCNKSFTDFLDEIIEFAM